jgi:hypothetical protein
MSALEVPWDVSWPARTSTHRPHLSDERNHDRSRDETILDVDCTDNPHAAERRDDFGPRRLRAKWAKRDSVTGRIIDVKANDEPFKGVRKER